MPVTASRHALAKAAAPVSHGSMPTRAYGASREVPNVLPPGVDVKSADFQSNQGAMAELVSTLQQRISVVKRGGGEKALEKHVARNKLPARQRVEGLTDEGSPFLELSPLAGYGLYPEEKGDGVASGGIVTGIGRVHG